MLGIDYGAKRVGVAVSDRIGLIARPLEVVERKHIVSRVVDLVAEYRIESIVVGIPTALAGHEGKSAAGARELIGELEQNVGVKVEQIDERFTTRMAEEALLESGMRRQDRQSAVDKVAAAIILQSYLDRKRSGHRTPRVDL